MIFGALPSDPVGALPSDPVGALPSDLPSDLEQALKNYQHDLEGLQSALLGFKEALLEFEEGALNESASQHQQNDENLRLLSVAEVCLRLGSDKSSVHQKLRSGEIPSLTSGQATKVRQRDLEEYIRVQRRRHRALGGENGFALG